MRIFSALFVLFFGSISGCSGYGWLGTCNDPCPKKNQVRDSFCDCHDPNESTRASVSDSPSVYIERGSDADWNCPICVGGYPQILVNGSENDAKVKVSVETYYEDTEYEDSDWDTYLIGGGQDKFLGCTVVHSQSLKCSVKKDRRIVSKKFAGDDKFYELNERVKRLALSGSKLVISFANAGVSCQAICKNGGPDCISTNKLGEANQFEDSILQFRGKLKTNSQEVIQKKEIMKMFNVKEDPCERGNTILSNDYIANTGEYPCDFHFSLPLRDMPLNMAFHMPETVKGNISVNGEQITVDFDREYQSPSLEIQEEKLHLDWGGCN